MTPEKKAIDLVQKFEGLTPTPFDGLGNLLVHESVRQRVLICCDEIIESYQQTWKNKDLYAHQPSVDLAAKDVVRYWQQVKERLQSL